MPFRRLEGWGCEGLLRAVTHDLVFDAVRIEEIEPPAGIVAVVAERFQARCHHLGFDSREIVDFDSDMIERLALGDLELRNPLADPLASMDRARCRQQFCPMPLETPS